MLVSALILAATFAGIFTEGLHQIHRTKVAMVGAAAMVFSGQIFGFYGPDEAILAIDWNVGYSSHPSPTCWPRPCSPTPAAWQAWSAIRRI